MTTPLGVTVVSRATSVVPNAVSSKTASSPLLKVEGSDGGITQLAVVPTSQTLLTSPFQRGSDTLEITRSIVLAAVLLTRPA